MQVNQIRKSFLDYFEKNEHKIITSSPLVPHNDPTLMFTNAGMVQFKNYFIGVETPEFTRAASAQKCVRAGGKHNDLENVGYTARHHTFFEMLGNFSFGDYSKDRAIEFAWEYLTKVLSIPSKKLYITIYHDDEEAYKAWRDISGFSDDKIIRITSSDNFWSMGDTGPCGPCSEIFYDHGEKYQGGLPGTAEADGDRYIEIWNLVFMQFEQKKDGSRVKLPKKSVDTGMGLERISAVLQGTNHNYEIDLFQKLIDASIEISNNKINLTSHRVIADHLRATSFLLADGVMPSNEGRGYVLRRIMRRAMRHIHNLGVKEPMMYKLVHTLVKEMGDAYPELKRAEPVITSTLRFEEERFKDTLDRGLKLLNASVDNLKAGDTLPGHIAFKLYDTYGFPLDLTKDILKSQQIQVDEKGFNQEMQEQKQRAKAAWIGSGEKATEEIWYNLHEQFGATEFLGYVANEAEAVVIAIIVDGKNVTSAANCEALIVLNQTPFYAESGGQVGDTGFINNYQVTDTKKYADSIFAHFTKLDDELQVGKVVSAKIDILRRNKIRANHSATHILHKVLRATLGEHVVQKGSIVTPDKLRFDFSHNQGLTKEQIFKIEQTVNQMVIDNYEVSTEILSPENAIEKGAMALFGEKYGNEVRTVGMGVSLELCGGTHVSRTGDIGLFKITSEEAIAAGIRRIEALTTLEALNYVNAKEEILRDATTMLKCSETDLIQRINSLSEEKKKLEKEVSNIRIEQVLNSKIDIKEFGKIQLLTKKISGIPPQDLKIIASSLLKRLNAGLVLIASIYDNKVSMLIYVTNNITEKYNAGDIIKQVVKEIDGNGGGKADIAQAGGSNIAGVDKAIDTVIKIIDRLSQ